MGKQAFMRLDLRILRELLRLPADVTILSVRQSPDNAHQCLIDIQGTNLPGTGEVVAEMAYENTTVVKFKGWKRA